MIDLELRKTLLSPAGAMAFDVALSVGEREFVAVYGNSGAGKTTLLRMLAGLVAPDGGFIRVGGETWYDGARRFFLEPRLRSIGFVFQESALFPNMSVRKNLEFALGGDRQGDEVDRMLAVADLADLADRHPDTLSGGQRQRVALARALARRPRLLLLDEPLSALDGGTRVRLQDEILRLHREFGTTAILVSHDLPEVFRLSDRVFLIDNGRIVKSGRPETVFLRDRVSGKFRFAGEILAIRRDDPVFIVTARVGNHAVNVVASREEAEALQPGDRVILFSKAFNPIILKV
jgi:molybdate transport system ATP-binding protein